MGLELSDELIHCYRLAAVALVHYACGPAPRAPGRGWRSKNDPVYLEVVEGRDVGPRRKRYSSCADLAHWLVFRLGVRAHWINRDEHRGFKDVVNLSRIAYCPEAETPRRIDHAFEPGDLLVLWNRADTSDAHVNVCLEHDTTARQLLTGDYGASGMSTVDWPGCKVSSSGFRFDPARGLWVLQGARSSRAIQRHVSLASILRAQDTLEPPRLEGAELSGEVFDALQSSFSEPI